MNVRCFFLSGVFLAVVMIAGPGSGGRAADYAAIPTEQKPGDRMLAEYFARETGKLTERTAELLEKTDDWPRRQGRLRGQLFDMLGLDPLPERTPLQSEIRGTTARDGVVVEKLVFQSLPGLYVTADFYRPERQDGPLPTILYLCGHGKVEIDGKSYGNKVAYQHHAGWFARNGFTCLVVDTLQLGEIEGTHHGTHREGRWWWNSRGYTPAGVEAWNGMRALDYLETRPEVDAGKLGATGRSGGGAYTFWIAALDERIKVAAPVAGITSLHNHVVDGCVEGHCDCMFMVNTRRWDFPVVAALIAPRPLLILNTDKDGIFPLDGVVELYGKTRKLYAALGAEDRIGLALYEGPHKDTQPLRVPAFHWFTRFLQGAGPETELATAAAPKLFEPGELKVFDELPADQRNTRIDEEFTKAVKPEIPGSWSGEGLADRKERMVKRLEARTFRGWPAEGGMPEIAQEYEDTAHGLTLSRWSFESQAGVRLPLFGVRRAGAVPGEGRRIVLRVLDEAGWERFVAKFGAAFSGAFPEQGQEGTGSVALGKETEELVAEDTVNAEVFYLAVRGIGPTAWTSDQKERTHIRRRFVLLGQTLDGMRVWDIRRGVQAVRELQPSAPAELSLEATGHLAGDALYAALWEPGISGLDLHRLPSSHRDGPELLNVLRYAELPWIAALVAEECPLRIDTADTAGWRTLAEFAARAGWPAERVQIQELPE